MLRGVDKALIAFDLVMAERNIHGMNKERKCDTQPSPSLAMMGW
jgi:hypothetical protein